MLYNSDWYWGLMIPSMFISPFLFLYFLGKHSLSKSDLLGEVLSVLIVAWLGSLVVAKLDFWFDPTVTITPSLKNYFHLFFQGQRWDGALLFSLLYILGWLGRKMKVSEHLRFTDSATLTICFLYCIGKVGCFLAGHNSECSGTVSNLPWAVHLPNLPNTYHPRQIYDSLFHLVLFFVLFYVYKRKLKFHGEITLIYLIVSPVYCFFSEYLSYNPKILFGLASGQIIDIIILIIGVSFIGYKYQKHKTELIV